MVEIPGLIWRSYEISSRVCSFLGRFYFEIEKEGLKRILVQLTAAGRRRVAENDPDRSYLCVPLRPAAVEISVPRRRITFQSFSQFAGALPYPSPVWAKRGRR